MKKNCNVICCGNVAYDVIGTQLKDKDKLTFEARPGGSVFNTSIQLARLGANVSILTKTGKDCLADSLVSIMKKENINIRFVFQDKKCKTGLAFARIDKKGDSSYVFYKTKGKENLLNKGSIPLSLFKNSSVFHTGSMYSYEDYTFRDALNLIKTAKKENLFTTFDPNWRKDRITNRDKKRKRIKKLLEYVDLLKLSDADAIGITGQKTLSASLKKLPAVAVITLKDKGSFFWNGKNKLHQSAFKVKIIDTIGAGDSFTAGLIYRYCILGKEKFFSRMKENLEFASASAAMVCCGRGATEGLKSSDQVRNFLKKQK